MKKILPIASIAVFLTGCNETVEKLADFSKPQLRDSDSSTEILQEPKPEPAVSQEVSVPVVVKADRTEFPTERTLTDVNGRSIEARILAKKGNQIAIARLPSNQRFILPLDKLAQADRQSLSSIRDGGDFEVFASSKKQAAMPANRRAVWHSQIINAEKEAAKLGIPLLVAVVVNGSPSAEKLEKNLAYSRDFKSWADQNVALCMIRTDGFKGAESREDTYENWVSLQKFGIEQSRSSSLNLIDPTKSTSTEIPLSDVLASGGAISEVDSAICDKSKWTDIVAAEMPIRAASPFRVASGST